MPRRRLILETYFCGSLSVQDILTIDGIELKPVYMLHRFSGAFKCYFALQTQLEREHDQSLPVRSVNSEQ